MYTDYHNYHIIAHLLDSTWCCFSCA